MKRTGLRYKGRPKERKVSRNTGVVRETAIGMAELRRAAFARSQGICECGCGKKVSFSEQWWSTFKPPQWGVLDHVWPRSDDLEHVRWIRNDCHKKKHGKPMFGLHTEPAERQDRADS